MLLAWALLAQGLWPASAMARPHADGGFVVQMCTPQGLQAATPDHPPPAGDHRDCCDLCVMAAPAPLPAVAAAAAPVSYARAVEHLAPAEIGFTQLARPPPRPPSQAPPLTA